MADVSLLDSDVEFDLALHFFGAAFDFAAAIKGADHSGSVEAGAMRSDRVQRDQVAEASVAVLVVGGAVSGQKGFFRLVPLFLLARSVGHNLGFVVVPGDRVVDGVAQLAWEPAEWEMLVRRPLGESEAVHHWHQGK